MVGSSCFDAPCLYVGCDLQSQIHVCLKSQTNSLGISLKILLDLFYVATQILNDISSLVYGRWRDEDPIYIYGQWNKQVVFLFYFSDSSPVPDTKIFTGGKSDHY